MSEKPIEHSNIDNKSHNVTSSLDISTGDRVSKQKIASIHATEEKKYAEEGPPDSVLGDFESPSDYTKQENTKDVDEGETSWEVPKGFQIFETGGEEGKMYMVGLLDNPDLIGGSGNSGHFIEVAADHDFTLSEFFPDEYKGLSVVVHDTQTGKIHTMTYDGDVYKELRGGKPIGDGEKKFKQGVYHFSNVRSPDKQQPEAPQELITRIQQEKVSSGAEPYNPASGHDLLYIDPSKQTMTHISANGRILATYGVSTSKVGIGTANGSQKTPNGLMKVSTVIGEDARYGEVFRNRRRTGQVADVSNTDDDLPNDMITTRIIRLNGIQDENKNTYDRFIYIHGTQEEQRTGRVLVVNENNEPLGASHGCIRTQNIDVAELSARIDPNTTYVYVEKPLAQTQDFTMNDVGTNIE